MEISSRHGIRFIAVQSIFLNPCSLIRFSGDPPLVFSIPFPFEDPGNAEGCTGSDDPYRRGWCGIMSARNFSLKEMLLTLGLAQDTHDIFTPFRADTARTIYHGYPGPAGSSRSRMYPADSGTSGDHTGTISNSKSCFRILRAKRGYR